LRAVLYVLFAIGGILVLLALAVVLLGEDDAKPVAPQRTAIEILAPVTPSINSPTPVPLAPSTARSTETVPPLESGALVLDIARVKPDGSALFAGTATPAARIRIFEGDLLLAETVADANGEWVIVMEKPLAPGQHLMSVAMERPDGTTELATRSLAVEVYEDQATKPLVALLPETATEVPVLIQSPDDAPAADVAKEAPAREPLAGDMAGAETVRSGALAGLAPTAIIWRDQGRILISGRSSGGVRVTALADGNPFGEALVLADGGWQIAGALDVARSMYRLHFTLSDNLNNVMASYDLPLKSRDLAKAKDGSPLVVVNKGDALWRIAYRSLGEGVRYVDIVRRNHGDISNPDLIYPKQIFAVPKSGQ
jgi:nucleoid-associated protein YgaU